MRFKKGQKVVCTAPGSGIAIGKDNHGNSGSGPRPSFNEIVTVSGYSWVHPNCIMLFEYQIIPPGSTLPPCYCERHFEPLVTDEQLEKELSTIPNLV